MKRKTVDVETRIRELQDQLLDAMERLEQADIDDDFIPLPKYANTVLNMDPRGRLQQIDPPEKQGRDVTKGKSGVCPECGQPGSPQLKVIVAKGKTYRYATFAHYAGIHGKTTRIRWCYLTKKK